MAALRQTNPDRYDVAYIGAPVLYLALAVLLGLAIHREAAWAWLAIGAGASLQRSQTMSLAAAALEWRVMSVLHVAAWRPSVVTLQ